MSDSTASPSSESEWTSEDTTDAFSDDMDTNATSTELHSDGTGENTQLASHVLGRGMSHERVSAARRMLVAPPTVTPRDVQLVRVRVCRIMQAPMLLCHSLSHTFKHPLSFHLNPGVLPQRRAARDERPHRALL